jgi:hypothetical protein
MNSRKTSLTHKYLLSLTHHWISSTHLRDKLGLTHESKSNHTSFATSLITTLKLTIGLIQHILRDEPSLSHESRSNPTSFATLTLITKIHTSYFPNVPYILSNKHQKHNI